VDGSDDPPGSSVEDRAFRPERRYVRARRITPTVTQESAKLKTGHRSDPRPKSKNGEEFLTVNDGLVTVIKKGDAEILEEGMMFKLSRRTLSARKIDVKPRKFRGSGNHHKFLVIVHDGNIAGGAAI
jgi:hypothetical protein